MKIPFIKIVIDKDLHRHINIYQIAQFLGINENQTEIEMNNGKVFLVHEPEHVIEQKITEAYHFKTSNPFRQKNFNDSNYNRDFYDTRPRRY